MIGFAPTAEQEAIRDLAHEVAVEQFRPLARTAEELGGIPVTLLPVLNQTGLADLFSPAGVSSAHERPGMLDAVTLALVTEELGFGDGGLALALVGRWLGSLALLIAGTPEQQHQPLVEVSSAHSAGRAVTHVPIAVALAEEAAGFDPSSLDTTARLSGPQYVLSGTKYAVLSGIGAQQYIVLANIAPELGAAGLCLFLVPSDVTGLTVTHDEQPLGLRAAPLSRLRLTDVRVPMDALLGQASDGAAATLRLLSLYAILISGIAVGISRAALEYSVEYARTRVQFGRPIAAFQGVAFLGAEMAMNVDVARLLLWRAASTWDHEGISGTSAMGGGTASGVTSWTLAQAACRKAQAVATQVTADAIQILGGAGYMEDHPLELWMRDAAALAALVR